MKVVIWGKAENREKAQICIEQKFGKKEWKINPHYQETEIFNANIYDKLFPEIINKYQDIKLYCYDNEDDEERGSGFWITHELKTINNEEGLHVASYSSSSHWS